MKIAYLCDSGTGRSIDYFKEKGIFSLPLQLACDNKTYQDMENMDNQACIDLLKQKKVYIITYNYDVFLERLLTLANITFDI